MNIINKTLKVIALCGVITFCSCEKDFSTVGGDVIGDNTFVTTPYDLAQVTAYSKKTDTVRTNGLPEYLLGAYDSPVYGLSEASILGQLTLGITDPSFGESPVLDSVVMVLPFHSTAVKQEGKKKTYELDSIYGSGGIQLSVYASNYYLRDFDPATGLEEKQAYYSSQQAEFENHLGSKLFDQTIYFLKNEVVLTGEEDTLRLSPRLRVHLPTAFFKSKIIDKEGGQELLSNANFTSYFRGLYLKAQAVNGGGSMASLKLASTDAKVVLYYTNTTTNDEGETKKIQNTYEFYFGGNMVNVFNNNSPIDLSSQDKVMGESNLYLQGGGQGSMAVIELFSGPDSDADGVSDELESLRQKDWLINEANLIFYVDEGEVIEGQAEPQRLYLYDLEHNNTIIDYKNDISANTGSPFYSRVIHLGMLSEDEAGNRYYKIRLTDHIRYILNDEAANVKLGLTVASNVNLETFSKLKEAKGNTVSMLPVTTLSTPEGTVLFGNTAADMKKRLKLRIYYTEAK